MLKSQPRKRYFFATAVIVVSNVKEDQTLLVLIRYPQGGTRTVCNRLLANYLKANGTAHLVRKLRPDIIFHPYLLHLNLHRKYPLMVNKFLLHHHHHLLLLLLLNLMMKPLSLHPLVPYPLQPNQDPEVGHERTRWDQALPPPRMRTRMKM